MITLDIKSLSIIILAVFLSMAITNLISLFKKAWRRLNAPKQEKQIDIIGLKNTGFTDQIFMIAGGRRHSKVSAAIHMSAMNKLPILCKSQNDADRLKEIALNLGFSIPEPIAITEKESKL